jgi:hypothetical protein
MVVVLELEELLSDPLGWDNQLLCLLVGEVPEAKVAKET